MEIVHLTHQRQKVTHGIHMPLIEGDSSPKLVEVSLAPQAVAILLGCRLWPDLLVLVRVTPKVVPPCNPTNQSKCTSWPFTGLGQTPSTNWFPWEPHWFITWNGGKSYVALRKGSLTWLWGEDAFRWLTLRKGYLFVILLLWDKGAF